METFGQRLRRLRMGRGLSQVALADRTGMDRSHIIKIETGRIMVPAPETVQRTVDGVAIIWPERLRPLLGATT